MTSPATMFSSRRARAKFVLLGAALATLGATVTCSSDEPSPTAPPDTTTSVAPAPTTEAPAPTTAPPTTAAIETPAATETTVPTETTEATELGHAEDLYSMTHPDAVPIQGGTLQLLGLDPSTLDPHLVSDVASYQVASSQIAATQYVLEIFSGLLTVDAELQVVPDIAQDTEVDPTGRIYTFRLNPDATFHDGRKVTASDFQWSFERAADPATDPGTEFPAALLYLGDIVGVKEKLKGEADSISGITVLDDATLRLEIDAPKPYFLQKLTQPAAFVLDRANVESGPEWFMSPNGTGPFTLAEYRSGVRLTLDSFDGHHLEPAFLDSVEFDLSGADGVAKYENDELHAISVGLEALEILHDPHHRLNTELYLNQSKFDIFYIGMNINQPPFDDLNVRLALNYAIDRQTMQEVLLSDTVVPAFRILPPGYPGYETSVTGYDFDLEKAQELLANSKYDASNFPEITMVVPGAFGSQINPVVQAIRFEWEELLGVRLDILHAEWDTFLQDVGGGRSQILGGLGWVAGYADPQDFLDNLFHSESGGNFTGYSDPEVDSLLERARVAEDPAERYALYGEVEQKVIDDAVWVPLYHSGGDHVLIKPDVQGFPLAPMAIPYLRYVRFIEQPE